MDLQTRKISFIQEFLKFQNEEIIAKFEKLLKAQVKKDKDSVEPMTLDEFNKRIDKSLDDSRNGKLTDIDELKSEIKKWN